MALQPANLQPTSRDDDFPGDLVGSDPEFGGGLKFSFPTEVADIDHWVAFRTFRTRQASRDENARAEFLADIILPMPANLSTSYNPQWEGQELGTVGEAAARAAGTLNLDGGVGEVTSSLLSFGQEVLSDVTSGASALNLGLQVAGSDIATIIGAAAGDIVGKIPLVPKDAARIAGGLVGEGLKQALQGALYGKGIARNPHAAQLFSGVNFRTHNFSYTFSPKSKDESNELYKIIKWFKWASSPSFRDAKSQFFNYPNSFDIDFNNEDYLFSIGECNLTSFSVDYHGQGTPLYFKDTKAPVQVTMNMSFTEVKIVTKDSIDGFNR